MRYFSRFSLVTLGLLASAVHAQEYLPPDASGYGAPTTPAPAPKGMFGHYGDATTDTARGTTATPWFNPSSQSPHDLLGTSRGWSLGLQAADYQYQEPDIGVKISGGTYGLNGAGTTSLIGSSWARVEADGWVGPSLDYKGATFGGSPLTGSKSDVKGEARLLLGADFAFVDPDFVLAPYLGYGVRDLYDNKGSYDQPAAGYRRNNFLQYLAGGADTRFRVFGQALEWRNEYDYVTTGKQTSYFSDTGNNDVTTTQNGGWGYRTHLAVLTHLADVGVYYQHWSVDASNTGFDGSQYIYEPANRTNEVGVFIKHRF